MIMTAAAGSIVSSSSKKKMTKKHGRGRSNSLQPQVVEYLKKWLMSDEHINHPYPTEVEKVRIVADTGIDMKRLNNWFVNNRIRYWKPRFEALQKHQQKGKKKNQSKDSSSLSSSSALSLSSADAQKRGHESEESKPSPPEDDHGDDTPTKGLSTINAGYRSDVNINPLRVVTPRLDLSQLVQTVINDINDVVAIDDDRETVVAGFDLFYHHRLPTKRQRKHDCLDTNNTLEVTPRFKYMRKNVEQWKLACLMSPKLDDKNLPTLDEAAHLFGYPILTASSSR